MNCTAQPIQVRQNYVSHPEKVRLQAVYLAQIGWGGARKISSFLSKRHDYPIPEGSVQDWIRKVRVCRDPLAGMESGR